MNGFAEELGPDGKAVISAGAGGALALLKALADRLGIKTDDLITSTLHKGDDEDRPQA